jgi:hypothetical protein
MGKEPQAILQRQGNRKELKLRAGQPFPIAHAPVTSEGKCRVGPFPNF